MHFFTFLQQLILEILKYGQLGLPPPLKAYKEVKFVIEELIALCASYAMLHLLLKNQLEVNVIPSSPRTTGRQRHRDNTEHSLL